jgi:hypothetical protein
MVTAVPLQFNPDGNIHHGRHVQLSRNATLIPNLALTESLHHVYFQVIIS